MKVTYDVNSLADSVFDDFQAEVDSMALSKKQFRDLEKFIVDFKNSQKGGRITSEISVTDYAKKLGYLKRMGQEKVVQEKILQAVAKKIESKPVVQAKPVTKIETKPKPLTPSAPPAVIKSNKRNLSYSNTKGQMDMFGSNKSAFNLIKYLTDEAKINQNNDNQSSFDFKKPRAVRKKVDTKLTRIMIDGLSTKALKQIKAVGMGTGGSVVKSTTQKPRAKRPTKLEKEKLAVRQGELAARAQTEKERERQHRSNNRFNNKKLNLESKKFDEKKEYLKLDAEMKEKLSQKNSERKINNSKANAEIKKQLLKTKAEIESNKHVKLLKAKIEGKIKLDDATHERRLELKKISIEQQNRHQLQRDLHNIHPALGALYGASQGNRNQNSNEDGVSGSAAAGLGVAGAGGAVGAYKLAKGALKMGAKGLSIAGRAVPILGAVTVGAIEAADSGDKTKGVVTGLGALAGGAIGGKIAGAIGGRLIGALAGAPLGPVGMIIGGLLGEVAVKKLYNALVGDSVNADLKNIAEKGTPRNPYRNGEQKPSEKGFGRFSSQSVKNTSPKSNAINPSSSSSSDFLADEEGLSLNAYKDGTRKGQQLVSIGRGHQLKENELAQGYIEIGNEKVPISGENGLGTKLTKEQANLLYNQDLKSYSAGVEKSLGSDLYSSLNENQKMALNSYAYNTGSISKLNKEGLKEAIASGDKSKASSIIKDKGTKTVSGVYSESLNKRRTREADLFSSNSIAEPIKSAQNSANVAKEKSSSKPVNVVMNGGSSGGSQSSSVTNVYNAPTTDPTIRTLANNTQYPARI